MSDDVLETVRATVQDLIAPELKTHGVRLDHIERRIDDMKHSLEQRIDDLKHNIEQRLDDTKNHIEQRLDDAKKSFEIRLDGLQYQITETKETLRAEIRVLEARFETLEARFRSLEDLIRSSMRQIESDGALRERVALLEVRMPKQ